MNSVTGATPADIWRLSSPNKASDIISNFAAIDPLETNFGSRNSVAESGPGLLAFQTNWRASADPFLLTSLFFESEFYHGFQRKIYRKKTQSKFLLPQEANLIFYFSFLNRRLRSLKRNFPAARTSPTNVALQNTSICFPVYEIANKLLPTALLPTIIFLLRCDMSSARSLAIILLSLFFI